VSNKVEKDWSKGEERRKEEKIEKGREIIGGRMIGKRQ
jgi:hypothetical protein